MMQNYALQHWPAITWFESLLHTFPVLITEAGVKREGEMVWAATDRPAGQ